LRLDRLFEQHVGSALGHDGAVISEARNVHAPYRPVIERRHLPADRARRTLLLGDQHPVESGEAIGLHFPLELLRYLKLGLRRRPGLIARPASVGHRGY
jgi:hypothetical protein